MRSDITPGFGMALGDRPVSRPVVAAQRSAGAGALPSPWDAVEHWLETKPPHGEWFNKGEQITLAASAQQSAITGFRIPSAHLGVLRFFANATANASDSSSVQFALLINNAPKPGFAKITGPMTSAINSPLPILEPLKAGDVVTVVATNLSSAAIAGVAAFIRGWYWPAGR